MRQLGCESAQPIRIINAIAEGEVTVEVVYQTQMKQVWENEDKYWTTYDPFVSCFFWSSHGLTTP